MYKINLAQQSYDFKNLRQLMAKASPARSGDYLAGVAAETIWSGLPRNGCWPMCR